jgi:hypothetical protein
VPVSADRGVDVEGTAGAGVAGGARGMGTGTSGAEGPTAEAGAAEGTVGAAGAAGGRWAAVRALLWHRCRAAGPVGRATHRPVRGLAAVAATGCLRASGPAVGGLAAKITVAGRDRDVNLRGSDPSVWELEADFPWGELDCLSHVEDKRGTIGQEPSGVKVDLEGEDLPVAA